MELVLVRHAEPEWVREGLTIDDPPLTERGFEQAERLATRLAEERFDEVLVSPLLRARQTAAPLLRRLGLPLRTEPWMHEIRSPVWQGTPAEKAEAAFKAERAKPSHDRWEGLPGGESGARLRGADPGRARATSWPSGRSWRPTTTCPSGTWRRRASGSC